MSFLHEEPGSVAFSFDIEAFSPSMISKVSVRLESV